MRRYPVEDLAGNTFYSPRIPNGHNLADNREFVIDTIAPKVAYIYSRTSYGYFYWGDTIDISVVVDSDMRPETRLVAELNTNRNLILYRDYDNPQLYRGVYTVHRDDQATYDLDVTRLTIQTAQNNTPTDLADNVLITDFPYINGLAANNNIAVNALDWGLGYRNARRYGNSDNHDIVDGDDEMYGGLGDDEMYGGLGDDEMYGENGHDYMYGGSGNDEMYGNRGDDEMYGGSGGDKMYGGAGDDKLYGGGGDDRLTGGAGKDTFIYDSFDGDKDTIFDFKVGEDVLDFSAMFDGIPTMGTHISLSNRGNYMIANVYKQFSQLDAIREWTQIILIGSFNAPIQK